MTIKSFVACSILCLLVSCSSTPKPGVAWQGEVHKVMRDGDLTDNAFLSELTHAEHLYAIGPVSQLDGEITVIDGKCYIAQSDSSNNVTVQEDCSLKAPFLVYGYFPAWIPVDFKRKIRTRQDLARSMTEILIENGFITEDPSAIIIEAKVDSLDYHIVKKDRNDFKGTLRDQNVMLMGFYSKNHEGVFTHKGQNLHLHFLSADQKASGHVDDFVIQEGARLKIRLPYMRK